MNLAVQNEVTQRELGVATSSSQLFRGLGSTVGVAILGSLLTVGVATSFGNYQKDPYVIALKQQPSAVQILGSGDVSVDTVLTLNTADITTKINQGVDKGLSKQQLPDQAKKTIKDDFLKKQANFKEQVVNAFTESLHHIFYTSAALMGTATLLGFAMKEKPLRGGHEDTPGMA